MGARTRQYVTKLIFAIAVSPTNCAGAMRTEPYRRQRIVDVANRTQSQATDRRRFSHSLTDVEKLLRTARKMLRTELNLRQLIGVVFRTR